MTVVRSEAELIRMRHLWRGLREASQGMFRHDGLIYFGVPKEVVTAYVEAVVDGADVVRGCVAAWAGEALTAAHEEHPDWLFWRIGRAWAWKLGEIERGISSAGRAA